MNFLEIITVLQWWFFIFLIGVVFFPLTSRLFSTFHDKGYAFSKIVGIIFLSYFTFLLGIFHILPFSRWGLIVVLIVLATFQFYRFNLKKFVFTRNLLIFFVLEEVLFLTGIFLWTYVRGFAPEIHGLEKYMDYGFINSILRAEYFPPKDMWLTPHSINYYYFGHLVTAVLTKLSSIPSQFTYNLMLGTLVGFTFTASFSIGSTLYTGAAKTLKNNTFKMLTAGILTALLVTFSGNLHTIYTMYAPYENEKPVPFWELKFTGINPCYQKDSYAEIKNSREQIIQCTQDEKSKISLFPNSYWYPNATRFIHNTIHEFPIYSWVVADLHGHVLDIPFVLLSIGFALALYLRNRETSEKVEKSRIGIVNKLQEFLNLEQWGVRVGDIFFAGFLLAIMYMTNAWDGIIYLMLFSFLFLFIFYSKSKRKSFVEKIINFFPTFFATCAIVFLTFISLSLPFSIFFKPFASGVGVICGSEMLGGLIGNKSITNDAGEVTKLFVGNLGPFLFEENHCLRSPIWQLFILYGFFYFFVISFLFFAIKAKKLLTSDIFVLILILLATLLIAIPEFIYLKDIYPDHYRANTMFKLVFQAFIILSIVSAYIIVRLISIFRLRNSSLTNLVSLIIFIPITVVLLSLVFIYPYQATYSYYGNLTSYKGIDGIDYLKKRYPDDYRAIEWLNKNISGQPVILEAQGDSYTDYARVSSNTGLPTVLGWTVHEWLWRGSYDVPAPKIAEIQTLYESSDIKKTRSLIEKYNIDYVFVGNLEREKYPALNVNKFDKFGKIVFRKGETRIYKLNK